MNLMEAIIAGKLGGSGGGGGAGAVRYDAGQTLTSGEQAQARENVGAASAADLSDIDNDLKTVLVTEIAVSGTTPTVAPAANKIYKCGELTSLTISNPPADGAWSVVFTSGATPTSTTIPATILGLESFAASADTLYEINVLDNRAVVGSWAVSSE